MHVYIWIVCCYWYDYSAMGLKYGLIDNLRKVYGLCVSLVSDQVYAAKSLIGGYPKLEKNNVPCYGKLKC